jgi:hypothetical protein
LGVGFGAVKGERCQGGHGAPGVPRCPTVALGPPRCVGSVGAVQGLGTEGRRQKARGKVQRGKKPGARGLGGPPTDAGIHWEGGGRMRRGMRAWRIRRRRGDQVTVRQGNTPGTSRGTWLRVMGSPATRIWLKG